MRIFRNKTLRYSLCVCGVYVFFLAQGLFNERITSVEYRANHLNSIDHQQHSHFRFSIFLVFVQSLMSVVASFTALKITQKPLNPPSLQALFEIAKLAACYLCATILNYKALGQTSYLVVILGKSCKLLSSILVGTLLYRRRFTRQEVFLCVALTVSVSCFMIFDGKKQTKQNSNLLGPFFISLLLFFDGLSNSIQDRAFKEHRELHSLNMMFFAHLCCVVFSFLFLFCNPYTTELLCALRFLSDMPELLPDLFAMCLCSALGQLFIFNLVEEHGTLNCLKITVTRKLFTILLSLFFFGHKVTIAQGFCLFAVFAILLLEAFLKAQAKTKKIK